MQQILVYLFWPNPGNATYGSPKSLMLMVVCGLLVLGSIAIRMWRRRTQSGTLRKLSKSWSTAAFWFGITGFVLIVSRAEQIQYLSMRVLWVVWILLALLYLYLQMRVFRSRYYQVMPTVVSVDPREKYLPKSKK